MIPVRRVRFPSTSANHTLGVVAATTGSIARMEAPDEPFEPAALTGEQLAALYRERFDDDDFEYKAAFWRVLCEDFFQKYIPPGATVVDLGAGSCEFINAIDAAPTTNRSMSGFRSTALVRLYLRMRFAWPLFGRQMFALATRRPESPLVH